MDERPYFTKVEEKRGRVGYHIDAGFLEHSPPRRFIPSDFTDESFAVTPIPNGYHSEFYKAYAAHLTLQGHRVVLSGVGGDDAMGRTLTPRPEFQKSSGQSNDSHPCPSLGHLGRENESIPSKAALEGDARLFPPRTY